MSVSNGPRDLRPHQGEYEDPLDNLTSEGLQQRFLDRIRIDRPEVLVDLSGRPLELYHQIWQASNDAGALTPGVGPLFDLRLGKLPWWDQFKYADEREPWIPPVYVDMHMALKDWSGKWHLVDDWIMNAAVETLAAWAPNPNGLVETDLRFRGWAHMAQMLGPDQSRFSFTHPGWQPTLQRWTEVKKELKEAFKQELKAYEGRIREAARDEGWVRVKDWRFRKGNPMEWLIARVVDAKSPEAIAEEVTESLWTSTMRLHPDDRKISPQAESDAITDLKNHMGITLPVIPHGRRADQL